MYERHGKSLSPVHKIWLGMRTRCSNPNARQYADYGGRGIKVCSRWDEFLVFEKDMGPRPKGHTLERIDNDKDYTPENCKWATRKEQANNRRCNIKITYKGLTKTISQWSEETGLHRNTIDQRFRLGWPARKIFSEYKQMDFSGLSIGGAANGARQRAKTHCPNGHPYNEENTRVFTGSNGGIWRRCRVCAKLRARAKKKQKAK